MLAVEVHTIVTEWGTLRFRLTDFFQQRTVVGPHLSVKPRFDCILAKNILPHKFFHKVNARIYSKRPIIGSFERPFRR